MSEKKVEKIGGPWGGLLIQKINEVIDVLNGEDEEKPEGFQGPRGEPGVPGVGEWGKSKEWKKLCNLIGYHPQDERLVLIIKLVEEEKAKSYKEGRIKQLEEDIEQVGESLPYQKRVEDTDRFWIPTQILMELEDDLKLLKSKLSSKDNGGIRANGENVS